MITIYANGIVHCSVCAPKEMSREDVAKEVNAENPSGVGNWVISSENFADGSPNPNPCNDDKSKLHYLMVC